MNKYKSINDLENRLLGIHSETSAAMMCKLLKDNLELVQKYINKNPDDLITKGFLMGLSDDENIAIQAEQFMESIPSENNSIYSNVRNFFSNTLGTLGSIFSVIENVDFKEPDATEIEILKNKYNNNQKVQDFCDFYYAVQRENFATEVNKMILNFLVKDEKTNCRKIENWLFFLSLFRIISDENNWLLATANYLLFQYCLGKNINQLSAKDYILIYKDLCQRKTFYDKNAWIFFALYKVMTDLSEDEFEFIFRTKNLIPDYYLENYVKACKSSGHKVADAFNILTVSTKGVGTISRTEINQPQVQPEEFLYKLYITGMFKFLYNGCPDFADYKDNFYNQFCDWTENSKIIIESILNKMAKRLGFDSEIVNPFTLDYSDNFNPTDLRLTFAEIIYTFKNITSGLNYDIINLINYVERKQCDYFVVKTDVRRETNKSDYILEKLQKTRDKLGKLDKGITLNVKETMNFLRSIDSQMYVLRPMKVKVFIEADMCLYSKDENEMDYEWNNGRLRERFRRKHKKCLDNIYLYRLRDQITHFRNYDITLNLLEDKYGRKQQLFESLYDGIQKMQELAGNLNDSDTNQAATLYFWIDGIAEVMSRLLSQTRIDYVGKPLLPLLYDPHGELNKEIFGENPANILDNIKFNSPQFPSAMHRSLEDLLNFMFGVQSNFLEEHRYSLIMYLIYLSFGIVNPKNR